jgi:ATP phosphoribosyltransferase
MNASNPARASLVLAVPSKGRLMELTLETFARAGLPLVKTGQDRGYRGIMQGLDGVEAAYLSASEIASHLASGRVHLGVTGEDLVREEIVSADERVDFAARLGFGHADVIVAVPQCWIDVDRVADLEDVGAQFYRQHGRRLRVATKYLNLTRRFFAERGVVSYRIVESLGATEAAPAAGAAEAVVDITSTGATLRANHLKILSDGLILQSQANLVSSRAANWTPRTRELARRIAEAVRAACP